MLSSHIGPRLKRDFLRELPIELALHILSFVSPLPNKIYGGAGLIGAQVDDARTLARASCVSRYWRRLLEDEQTWKEMCQRHRFQTDVISRSQQRVISPPLIASPFVTPPPAATRNAPNVAILPRRTAMSLNLDQDPVAANADDAPEAIPGSENTLRPVFGITNPQMFAASRVERDSGLMEVDTAVPSAPTRARGAISATNLPAPRLPNRGVFEQPTSPTHEAETRADATTPEPSYNPFNNTTLADAPDAIPSVWDNQNSDNHHRQQTPLPSVVASSARSLVGTGYTGGVFGEEEEEEEERRRFSYKAHFKRAYLTGTFGLCGLRDSAETNLLFAESNWLRGGKLLSSHTSSDDGVVTSLAVDDDYIVIGMANSKIHIFNAHNGTFLRTLTGHELGVWCLTLVSAAKGTRIASEGTEGMPYEGASHSTSGPSKGRKRRVTSWTDTRSPSGPAQHRPFSGFNFGDDAEDAAYGSMMDDSETTEEPLPRARRMRQSDVCGAAVGWGQKDAIIISGGCDRDVKVWNVTTG